MSSSAVIASRRAGIVFNYAFRPFFLATGLSGVAVICVWLATLVHGTASFPLVPARWHAHEMLFGFAAAAIAGFLLTAVPNWTGGKRLHGLPLAALAALWLAGRLALVPGVSVPPYLAAAADLAFLPALAIALAAPLVRARAWRNIAFLPLLAALTLANLTFHLDHLGWTADLGATGLALAFDVVLLMVVVIGGRIVPAFTRNVIPPARADLWPVSHRAVERLAIASVALMALADVVAPDAMLTGALAGLAAAVHAVRLVLWKGWSTLRRPILWVLHLGYLWIPIALTLKAAWLLAGASWASTWQHALSVGVFGTMILAVMSRAALGHSGRPLVVSPLTTAAYGLVTVAAASRVIAPSVGDFYLPAISLAGAAWIAAFALFLLVYVPILSSPRVDGRE